MSLPLPDPLPNEQALDLPSILRFPVPAQLPSESAVPPSGYAQEMTVREVVQLYLDSTRGEGDARARADKERVLDLFVAEFGDRQVGQCRKAELRSWLKYRTCMKAGRLVPLEAWTLHRWCATIQRPFNWAVKEEDCIERNPFAGVSFKAGKRGEDMSEAQYLAAMRVARGPFKLVLFFQWYTGARPGEMSALQWNFLVATRPLAVLEEHKTAHKVSKPRIIRLHPKVVRMLAQIRRRQEATMIGGPHQFVFLNSRGKPWTRNALVLRMRNVRQKAGLPAKCRLYSLRHSFATRMAATGANAPIIAEALGHQDMRMSSTYIHLGQHDREILDAIEKAMR